MKNTIRIEIKKAVHNKLFFLSVLLGCLITLQSLAYNIDIYQQDNYLREQLARESTTISNPLPEVYTLFNHWIGGEPFSFGSSLYFFVFPLLVAIPYGWSYCEEKRNGYNRMMVTRSGKKTYFFSKYIAVFLSGGLAMVVPQVFNFLLAAMYFPAITPVVIYAPSYAVFGGAPMSELFYTVPFLYVFLYLCIDFVFCGFIACISFALASFIKYKLIVVISPLFIMLLIHYSRQFVYVSYETVYKEISPFYFLRSPAVAYDASWFIILAEMAVLFLITFAVTMVWERKHEIY